MRVPFSGPEIMVNSCVAFDVWGVRDLRFVVLRSQLLNIIL